MTTPRRSFPPVPRTAGALVLTAHPYADSFNHALAKAWTEGARSAGLPVESIDIAALDFDPILSVATRGDQPLEPDLERVRDAIERAAHLVIAFPVWWGSTPAALKGLIDRVFLTGWAYRYEDHKPIAGLTGRSGRLLITMDAPTWYDRLWYGASARRQVGRATLRFSGVSPVTSSTFGSIGTSTATQREGMLETTQRAGAQDAAKVMARFPRMVTVAA